MNIPYETLVLIAASGGAIIIFGIAVAVLCICRHVRRSRKAIIHILTTPPPALEDADTTENPLWECNQLIPTAHILHSFNPKAKIQAISQRPTVPQKSHQLIPRIATPGSSPEKDVDKVSCPTADLLKQGESQYSKKCSKRKKSEQQQNPLKSQKESLQPTNAIPVLPYEQSVQNSQKNPSELLLTSQTDAPSDLLLSENLHQSPDQPSPIVEFCHLPSSSNGLIQSDSHPSPVLNYKHQAFIHLHLKPCPPPRRCSLQNNNTQISQSSSSHKPSSDRVQMQGPTLQRAQSFQDSTNVYLSSLASSANCVLRSRFERTTVNTQGISNGRTDLQPHSLHTLFHTPSNDEVQLQRPTLQRAQSFQDSTNAYLTSLASSSNCVPRSRYERTTVNTQGTSNARTDLQPRSSHMHRSRNPSSNLRQSLSKPSTSGTQSSRLRRTRSFQERTNACSYSEVSEPSSPVQLNQRSETENVRNEFRPDNRRKVRDECRRPPLRSRSMLTARQMQMERTRMPGQTRLSVNRRVICSSAEDVVVLDGSEPPPPYQS